MTTTTTASTIHKIPQRCRQEITTRYQNTTICICFVIYLYSLIFWICCAFKIHHLVILGKILYKKQQRKGSYKHLSYPIYHLRLISLVCGKQTDILGRTTVSDNTTNFSVLPSFLLSFTFIQPSSERANIELGRQDARVPGKRSTNIRHARSTEAAGLLTNQRERKRRAAVRPVKESHAKIGESG